MGTPQSGVLTLLAKTGSRVGGVFYLPVVRLGVSLAGTATARS